MTTGRFYSHPRRCILKEYISFLLPNFFICFTLSNLVNCSHHVWSFTWQTLGLEENLDEEAILNNLKNSTAIIVVQLFYFILDHHSILFSLKFYRGVKWFSPNHTIIINVWVRTQSGFPSDVTQLFTPSFKTEINS